MDSKTLPEGDSNSAVSLFIGIVVALLFAIFSSISGSAASAVLTFFVVFIVYISLSIRILQEWQRSPVLTLGRYKHIYGPGMFFIIPFLQTTPYRFDLRTFPTTFSAEKTLTSDNVTVDVEAIMFSKMEDPEKAVLQVTDIPTSVALAAQTALRDIIGKVELSRMIAGRTEIADEVKEIIDQRVLPWGMNVISVEIRDVKIPSELQDAMARIAVASRERDARVILAESEKLAASRMVDAANIYGSNHYAMQLRALNMMYEIGINGRNNIVFIPTESKGFGMPTPVGVFGLSDVQSGRFGRRKGQKQQQPPQQ